MAIHVDRITVSSPVLNSITLGAGGNLTVGTTYYYRLIAVRYYVAASRYALSSPSAEQAVTPTTGNQIAQLSWVAVANADAYIIQRTIVSGSYPVSGANTFNLNGRSWSGYPYATTLTNLNDDGGAVSRVRFNSPNLDFSTEFPLLEVYADSYAEVVTPYAIASALAGGGFTDFQMIGSAPLQAETVWQEQGCYQLRGNLFLRDCTFRLRATILCIPGDIVIKSNSVVVQFGDTTLNYLPKNIFLSMPIIAKTVDNDNYTSMFYAGRKITGKSGQTNYIRMYRELPFTKNIIGNHSGVDDSRYAGEGNFQYIDLISSEAGLCCRDGYLQYYSTPASKYNLFESLFLASTSPGAPLVDAVINNGSQLSMSTSQSNMVTKRCRTTNVSIDCYAWYMNAFNHMMIDHIFNAQYQSDNQPRLALAKIVSGKATLLLAVTRNFKILSSSGTPISGATVTAFNASGLSAFWADSLSTFSTALDAVTNPANLTVSDGTKFVIGDYIRCETCSECLRVTNIAANVLTVARAQLGTQIRATSTGNSNRVMKMVGSLATDATGIINCTEPILHRELGSVNDTFAVKYEYEDWLFNNGWITRNYYGPYVLRISAPGYSNYSYPLLGPGTDKFPVGPLTLEIALKKGGTVGRIMEVSHAVA